MLDVAKPVTERVKALQARRHEAGLCINDPRDSGGDPHPKPKRGNRECDPCREKRAAYNREHYRKRKAGG